MTTEKLNSALEMAKKGYAVFPVYQINADRLCSCEAGKDCGSPGKHPVTHHGFKDAVTEESLIQQLWEKQPEANVGLRTGDGFFVLDVDEKSGGLETLKDLEGQYGELPNTVEALTGGGGRHLYFKFPPDRPIGCKTGFQQGLDIRGNNGYVVIPPSNHLSGKTYQWEISCHPDDTQLAEAPQWLINMITEDTLEKKTANLEQEIPEGRRNTTLFKIACTLSKAGIITEMLQTILFSLNEAHSKPPLPAPDILRITNSASRYKTNANILVKSEPVGCSAKQLFAMELPPIKWILENYLPEGLCIFSGGTKIGKSWLALQLAMSVAKGEGSTLGTVSAQGTVIYLALEDFPKRLKNRIEQTMSKENVPDNLLLYWDFPSYEQDGLNWLTDFIDKHPDCSLVIIDTLGRFYTQPSSRQNAYNQYTDVLGKIQKLAFDKGLCILFIHHTRKGSGGDNDPFEEVLGSTAITGVADTNWLLKRDRTSPDATLTITGREVEEQELSLVRDPKTNQWLLEGKGNKKLHVTRQAISDYLLGIQRPAQPKEIHEALGGNYDNIKQTVKRMHDDQQLNKTANGYIHPSVTPSLIPDSPLPVTVSPVTATENHPVPSSPLALISDTETPLHSTDVPLENTDGV